MATVTAVPLNTMLADLDESIRALVARELDRHGFEGLEIVFEAPTREWASQLSRPTISLFLYDLREARELREIEWQELHGADAAPTIERRPPLRVDASYAVTAWTRDVEDEHRLLSQLLAILYAFDVLPDDVLHGGLRNGRQPHALRTRVAQPRQDGGADFWTAVGGQYKASLDYCVRVSCDPGVTLERGPEVRTQTVRVRQAEGNRAIVSEVHRVGGAVRDADGIGVPQVWVVLPDSGQWTVTGSDGRFQFERLAAGTYRCVARTADGSEASAEIVVPGRGADLVIGAKSTRKTRA